MTCDVLQHEERPTPEHHHASLRSTYLELQQRGVHDKGHDRGGRREALRHRGPQPRVPPGRVQHQPPRRHVAAPQAVQHLLRVL